MLYEDDKQYIPLLTAFLNLSSYIIEHLNYNVSSLRPLYLSSLLSLLYDLSSHSLK